MALAVVYLIVTAARESTAYYLTVAEIKAQGASETNVRIAGTVLGDSILWEPDELLLEFEIADESGVLPVSYKGTRPDMFQDGAEAVLEGRYGLDGTFEAHTILLKCPSRYEEAG